MAQRIILIYLISLMAVQQIYSQKSHTQLLMLQNPRLINCKFDKIYQLGDSMADTGNFIRESLRGANSKYGRFPYGMNFFQNATGRCSDGMLIIDFIALECGLPLLNPYKLQGANFLNGANFAVVGSTALPPEILEEKNISMAAATNSSLDVQLHWMSSHLKTTGDCAESLKNSLFLVGEIGGNDFNYGLLQGKTMKDLKSMVHQVVHTIMQAVRAVTGFGATRIVIPGNFPRGCFPVYLTQFKTNNSTAYDHKNHCLKDLNNLAIFYNKYLQQAIHHLNKEYPNITLIYGDYYNAYLWLLQNSASLGFDKNSVQKACCGKKGEYNFGKCGAPGVPICEDASTYISWDGVHLTQEAYKWLARWLIDDMLPKLNSPA